MTNVSCLNCKWRKDMVCIPCSRDCKSHYELTTDDLLSNKTSCDFYRGIKDQYCFGKSNVFYTQDVHDLIQSYDYDGFEISAVCIENPSKVIVNGVSYDYEDRKRLIIQIEHVFCVEGYWLFIIKINDQQIHAMCEVMTMRFDKENRCLFIDLIGAYEGGK